MFMNWRINNFCDIYIIEYHVAWKNEWTRTKHVNTNKSFQHNINVNTSLNCDSIYRKFKNRQNNTALLFKNISILNKYVMKLQKAKWINIVIGRENNVIREGHSGGFGSTGNVLLPKWYGECVSVY